MILGFHENSPGHVSCCRVRGAISPLQTHPQCSGKKRTENTRALLLFLIPRSQIPLVSAFLGSHMHCQHYKPAFKQSVHFNFVIRLSRGGQGFTKLLPQNAQG